MLRIVKTSRAEKDLVKICEDLGKLNLSAAISFIDLLEDRIASLAQFPLMGEICKQFGEGIRQFPVNSYVIFYRPNSEDILVTRIMHGSRDLERAYWENS